MSAGKEDQTTALRSASSLGSPVEVSDLGGSVASWMDSQAAVSNPCDSGESLGRFLENEEGGKISSAKFESCAEEVRAIIAREKADGKIVQAADDLEVQLRTMGLLTDMQIAPQQVGFDPANRHGEGGNAAAVHSLMEMIATAGWSWAACSHAMCVQTLPGDQKVEDYNRTMCYGTELPHVEPDSIRFGSLSAGHTNMGLRAIAAGMPCADPRLSQNGVYDVEVVRRHDAKFAEAVDKGLRWKVLKSKVRVLFPEVLNIFQACPLYVGRGVVFYMRRRRRSPVQSCIGGAGGASVQVLYAHVPSPS